MEGWSERVRRIIREHGPVTKDQLLRYCGVTESMKGTRSTIMSALWKERDSGRVLTLSDGTYVMNPDVALRNPCHVANKNDAIIIEYIKNNPGCVVREICDGTGISEGTVRHHLRRLPVASVLDVRTRRWYYAE